jgi:hypothetical protein
VSGAKQAWYWVLAVLVGLLGLVAYMAYRLKGNDAAAKLALADATEANAQRDIALKRERLSRLKKDVVKNGAKIAKTEAAIATKKTKLEEKFVSQGLTGAEIAERFRRIRL